MTHSIWKNSLTESHTILSKLLESKDFFDSCDKFSEIMISTYKLGGNVFSCGNGGSHCDAMHFAEELTGRFEKDRSPLGALALGDPSHVTCVSNDYGFEYIFSRQLEGLGRKGDLLLGLSTSGNSKNVIRAVESAKKLGITSLCLLGKTGGLLKDLADHCIIIPSDRSDRVQEMHIKIIHTLIETVERKIFPNNYQK
jgi:D-sedoheptulose 7-phosphate isomerase